ncbi:MAG: site-2 protease family protein, partial [Cyanobacteria bacterium P01_H01_bin.130]
FAIVPNPRAHSQPQTAPPQNATNNAANSEGIAPPGSPPSTQTSNPPTPTSNRPPATNSTQWLVDYQVFLALLLLALTLLTTTLMGAELVNNQTVMQRDWAFLSSGLPYSLSVVAILLAHEGSYYLAARSHRIPVTLPYLIPIPAFLGTCGVFSHLHGPIPDRKSLLDMSVAGPWGGLLVSLPLLGWGLSQSNLVPLEAVPNLFNVNALDPRYSLLLFLTSKIALPSFPAPSQGVALHPIAIAGYVGLWFTAIKLLPIGSFCGGRIIHAMVGQRVGAIVGQITRLALLALSLVRTEFLIIALALFFVPAGDRPALNDVSALDNYRDFAGLITLVLAALILLPAPRLLIQWLG